MMMYQPPLNFVQTVAEMVADTISLHHQIDQAFPIFLKNTGRPGYEANPEPAEGVKKIPLFFSVRQTQHSLTDLHMNIM